MSCFRPHFLRSIIYLLSTAGFLLSGSWQAALAQQYNPPDRGIPGRLQGAGTRVGILGRPSGVGDPVAIPAPVSPLPVFEPPDRDLPSQIEGGGTRGGSVVDPVVPPAQTSPSPAFEPPDRDLPSAQPAGGDTRGGSVCQDSSLIALMPSDNFGQTATAYPTWFWYVPPVEAAQAEFALLDESGNPVYQTQLRVDSTTGFVSFTLPDDRPSPLQPGQTYRWYFSLICNPQNRSQDIYTEGLIQPIEPDAALTDRLQVASVEDRATLYAEAGIWYDALATLATLRRDRPIDAALTQRWDNLLESVGLDHLSAAASALPLQPVDDLPPSSSDSPSTDSSSCP